MLINFIITYLVIGLSLNYGVSQLDKIKISDNLKESDKPLNPNLVILLWPILFGSICYHFINGLINR
jgi:hypothetical protein